MTTIIIYGNFFCPYCFAAKRRLKQLGIKYKEIRINKNPLLEQEMINKSGRFTSPQFFMNKDYIGGYSDFAKQAKSGKLSKRFELSTDSAA